MPKDNSANVAGEERKEAACTASVPLSLQNTGHMQAHSHSQTHSPHGKQLGRPKRTKRRPKLRFNFMKQLQLQDTNYDLITSVAYLNEKYGLKKAHYIEKFVKCIHRKINLDASRISDQYVETLGPWIKSKLFLLIVTLAERGGPEYWLDKNDQLKDESREDNDADHSGDDDAGDFDPANRVDQATTLEEPDSTDGDATLKDEVSTLTEQIIQQNINQNFKETTYDENYVFSSIWANFMEGLINHYLEKMIVPHSEMKVCQQLYKPMMKIISLYNEYNELMEKSEKNGFLPSPNSERDVTLMNKSMENGIEEDLISQERLQRAQKLLWQARQDIPKTISKELTLLSEMYSTLSADEQDSELDEFVCCAEEYIESEFLPGLVNVLFANCGSFAFWKVLLVLEPFFYYIEDVGESDGAEDEEFDTVVDDEEVDGYEENEGLSEKKRVFKPDPRVITLEKICEVAAKQNWI
ncbi:Aan1p KNAG_0H00400 [Huiozyma naganishii CBS 8797]|uniref:Uncharacterized protein n=1 Tax=Huiozyma naganishii (strain ATCC MYA-139 / BCRC 22969 / CBS 8797 / KCTC 17520 / NBRC 10181 / NCYC 3082 / Yp74L-3) TaxID=1071383 RepID=J7S9D6_HUIN7|nr:hypothetical protein KNAG_0H00400 [Kazachstania naganishii CBS 8797]CCK71456.1 hypothetical protein KNAG_0H00400 [Kazachstania naganishii CBS 8797]